MMTVRADRSENPLRRGGLSAMLLLAAALSLPPTALGQGNVRIVGFKAGLVTSSTKPQLADVPVGSRFTSVTAGLFGRVPLGGRFAAQGELNYSRLGTDADVLRLRSERLQVPLMLQYLLAASGPGLRAYAGPMFGMELTCSAHAVFPGTGAGDPEVTVATLCPFGGNAGGTSLVAGGLLDVPLGSSVVTVDLRYNHGISTMEARGFQPDYRGYRSFQATIGFGVR